MNKSGFKLHEEVLDLSRRQGEKRGMGITLFDLALLRVLQQRHDEARVLSAEGIKQIVPPNEAAVESVDRCSSLLDVRLSARLARFPRTKFTRAGAR